MKPNHDGTLDEEWVHSYNAPICAIILSTAQSAGFLVFLPMQCFHPLKYKSPVFLPKSLKYKNLMLFRKMTTLRTGRSCRWLQRSSLKITDSRSYKQFKYCSTPFLPNNSNSQYLFRRTFRTWCQIAPTWWVWHLFIVQLVGRSEIRRKSFYRKAWHCPINLQRKCSHLLFQ